MCVVEVNTHLKPQQFPEIKQNTPTAPGEVSRPQLVNRQVELNEEEKNALRTKIIRAFETFLPKDSVPSADVPEVSYADKEVYEF